MTRVMIGLDGRAHDSDAIALARLLHTALGGSLLLAHVTPVAPPGRGGGQYEAQQQQESQEIVLRASRTLGPPHECEVARPAPAPLGLARIAQRWGADTLVLGSSHRGPVGRIVPGSVASRLLAHAPCAIAVAPMGYADRQTGTVTAVGVAYDTTRAADAALQEASVGAARLGVPVILYHAMYPVPTDPAWDDFRGHMESFAQDIISSGLRRLPPDVRGSGQVPEGRVAEAVAEAASRDRVSLLYVGCRGHGPLREALIGGVAGGLLQSTRVPLVIVPTHAARSAPPEPSASATVSATRA